MRETGYLVCLNLNGLNIMLDIAKTSKCNGCHACFSICPVRAISMESDSEGFLRPVIDYKKCTGCCKCESVCPVLHHLTLPINDPLTFACKHKNDEIRLKSSSGGVFTALAEKIIYQGGVVFGARFDSKFAVYHDWTDDKEDLDSFRGSKYVQSRIGNVFIECRKFLEDNKIVMFTGTPCQIGGLKAFLGKEYSNLYTVDLICHGVPSPLLLERYLIYRKEQEGANIKTISFRRKDYGWRKYSLKITFNSNNNYCQSLRIDPFLRMFLKNVCLRLSCYNCVFKTKNRMSDITIADFWDIKNVLPAYDDDKGVSLVLAHSNRGQQLFEKNKDLISQQVNGTLSLKGNRSLTHSVKKPKKRSSFFIGLEKKDFQKIIDIYSHDCFFDQVFKIGKKIMRIPRKLKNILLGCQI